VSGNPDSAVVYLEKSYALRDTLHNQRTVQTIHDLKIAYETEKKEHEIERQQNIISQQNTQRSLLVAGVALCVVILALTWYMLRLRTRRNLALTERNDALSERNDTLAEMNTTKDKFFSIISHDLKNPAVAQRDALQRLVKNERLWDADALSDYHAGLLKSAEGQVELIYHLLNWSQLQTGRMTCTPDTFNLSARLRADIAMIRKMAENKGITLAVAIPDDALVTGDYNILSTVVRNLLTNAVKFTSAGGTVSLEASPNPSKGGEFTPPSGELEGAFIVSVSDTGTGMSREQIGKLFRMDSAHSRTGTSGEQGSGLGLIVCREMLEKHGSELKVESEEGKGSRFWFELKK
jgi:signal transduction histidine kinase